MIPVYRVRGPAQSSRMDDEPNRKRPWSPWQYIVLIVIAILLAVFVIRPIGLQIAGVFQRLTDAFQNGK
jgi:hypothetical protein